MTGLSRSVCNLRREPTCFSDFNPYTPRDYFTLITPTQKAFPFFQTVASSNKQEGGNTQPPLLSIKDVPLHRSMSTGCQNYTQLKQTNKTSCVSWIWDGGYKWVNRCRRMDDDVVAAWMRLILLSPFGWVCCCSLDRVVVAAWMRLLSPFRWGCCRRLDDLLLLPFASGWRCCCSLARFVIVVTIWMRLILGWHCCHCLDEVDIRLTLSSLFGWGWSVTTAMWTCYSLVYCPKAGTFLSLLVCVTLLL